MSYKSIRNALKSTIETVNVSTTLPGGWKFKERYPIKQAPSYPGFFVTPVRNTPTVTIDTANQEVPYTFWIYLVHSYQDPATAEDQLVELADAVLSHLVQTLKGSSLLPGVDFDSAISGEWGFDAEYGERFYRMEVTARVATNIL